MLNGDDNLIDAQDLKLTADEISAKALSFVQSIGTAETEEAEEAMAAKARAYFRRAVALQAPEPDHKPVTFPLPSEIRWQARHEGKSWDQIQDEWRALRSKIGSQAEQGWAERIELVQELARLECFIEDYWADQGEVVEEIRADRMAAKARRPPF